MLPCTYVPHGPGGAAQVADVLFVFDFWLIKGQLLATVPTSRASANIWEGIRCLSKQRISVRSLSQAVCPSWAALPVCLKLIFSACRLFSAQVCSRHSAAAPVLFQRRTSHACLKLPLSWL